MTDINKAQLLRHIAKSDLTAVEKRYLEGLVGAEDCNKVDSKVELGPIPCSEKKPKARTDVILQFDENMCVGFYSQGLWNVNTGNGLYTAVLPSEDQPIAWMPLPDPPEEVQHE